MINLFHKLNEYFIADPNEHIQLSDLIWFYGTLGILTMFLIVSVALNVTF